LVVATLGLLTELARIATVNLHACMEACTPGCSMYGDNLLVVLPVAVAEAAAIGVVIAVHGANGFTLEGLADVVPSKPFNGHDWHQLRR
jgi:hypothetical protein